ncbi:hypothetical protein HPB50_003950 [Hyalomma asiaticum]|uniref:Uncharacterized protein n=1 Tax=Hyalomma asiaticum TaxID=266040 RepID=A0ACB7RIU0_HYAAI|nr:hypothetical protein HPB50_003950 [Hyalomma asiaticum]
MKLGCLRSKQFEDHDLCHVFAYLFGLLEAKNLSVEYRFYKNWKTMFDDLYCEETDMVALLTPLHDQMLAAATYSEIMLIYETFYALESKTQAPSLFDTTMRCALTIAATAASLTVCAGILVFVGSSPVQERAQSVTLSLLAVLLATSVPLANTTRWPRVQSIVYLSWLLAMVPLSQYFRCELTSLVTVGRPASALDTLEELEAALDTGLAAPCVPRESASLDGIMYWDHPTALGKKLRASLKKHRDQLVTASIRSCFDCATKSGSVCFVHRIPSSIVEKLSGQVAAFDENFMTRASSMPLRKSFPLRYALRAFLLKVRESGLLSSPYCKYPAACTRSFRTETAPERKDPPLELRGFFSFYAVLLCGAVGVLAGELFVARFSNIVHCLRRRRLWR